MKYLKLILLLCAVSGVISVEIQAQKKAKKENISYKDQLRFDRLFIDADKAKILADYEQAVKLFELCVDIDPSQPAPHYELASLYMRYGEAVQAGKHALFASSKDPDNYYYRVLYAEILKATKAYKEAAEEYEKIVREFQQELNAHVELALIYILQKKYNEAVNTYDRLEKVIGSNEEIKLKKQYLYLQMGDVDKAAGEIEALIKISPNEIKYYVLLAEIYAVNKMEEKAVKAYERALEKFPTNADLQLSLSDFYHRKSNLPKAFEHLRIALAAPEINIDSKIQSLLTYFEDVEKNPALLEELKELGQILIKSHPEEAKSYTLNGDIFLNTGQTREARKYFMRAVELDQQRFPIWSQLMILEADLGLIDSLLYHCHQALGLFPNQPVIYYFIGYASARNGAYENATDAYSKGLDITVDNDQLKMQFYLGLGETYRETRQDNQSDAAFENVLKIDSNNTIALNNYSYYLSLRQEHLEQAKKMSARAIRLEPNQATFLDTYAWILYQMKDYTEAKNWMEKAIQHGGGESGVIIEHMGDILFKLEEKQEALKYWKKAKDLGGGSDLLEKKLNEERLYE